MARKHFAHYQDFLNSVFNFWEQLGPDFGFGEWNRAEVEKEKREFKDLNDRIRNMEIDLGYLRTERDSKCKRYENLSVRLRSAVLGNFSSDSQQMLLLPRLLKATVGRPNKAAETRKRNTLLRKAEKEAERIAAIVAESRAEG